MLKIHFKSDTLAIVDDILKSNQIEDSSDVVFQKLTSGKPSQGTVIFNAVERILENESEESVCAILKDSMGLSDDVAKKVYADILTRLVPFAEKQNDEAEPNNKKAINKMDDVPKKNIKTTEIKKPQQSSGPDSYREPIE